MSEGNAAAAAEALPESAQRVAGLLAGLGHDRPVVMLPATGKNLGGSRRRPGLQRGGNRQVHPLPPPSRRCAGAGHRQRQQPCRRGQGGGARGRARQGRPTRFVREKTGYAIGGVCPIGHRVEPLMLIDRDLFRYQSLWAAAGHPHAVFNLTPSQLQAMTGAEVADVAQDAQR